MIITHYHIEYKYGKRFVRKSLVHKDKYAWCIQRADLPAYDCARGICDAEDLPDDIRAKCDAYKGSFYACEWPVEE
jgi:hypothetical protein